MKHAKMGIRSVYVAAGTRTSDWRIDIAEHKLWYSAKKLMKVG